ncbi:MAG: hypothetical protein H7Y60_09830 [Rhodospirillaceae bacterium]|nr:hypothetical protein [Rhodospirillales bacterium]
MSDIKRHGLLVNGVVGHIVECSGPLPAGFAGVELPDHVGPGWRLDGDVWQPPAVPDLGDVVAAKVAAAKAVCRAQIEAKWPAYKQSNAALGIYGPDGATDCVTHINACRTACDIHEAAIDDASRISVEDVLSHDVTTGWPA